MTVHARSSKRSVCVECWQPWPCRKARSRQPTSTSMTSEGTLTARFPGSCPSCGGPIHPGERVARWSDNRYRHLRCTP